MLAHNIGNHRVFPRKFAYEHQAETMYMLLTKLAPKKKITY